MKPLVQTVNLCVLSNDAVRVNELPGHLHVPAGLVDQGEVEGDLSPQVHLVVRDPLQEEGRELSNTRTNNQFQHEPNEPPVSVQAVSAPSGSNVWPNV